MRKKVKIDLVVTRHSALVELLKELGVADEETQVVSHVSDPAILEGKRVAGILPLHLAAKCREVWTPEIELRPEDRGRELSLEELKERFRGLRRFVVLTGAEAESIIKATIVYPESSAFDLGQALWHIEKIMNKEKKNYWEPLHMKEITGPITCQICGGDIPSNPSEDVYYEWEGIDTICWRCAMKLFPSKFTK